MFYVDRRPAAAAGERAIFAPDGRLLGVADLFDPEAGLVTEFDGQDHRRRRQHRADNPREEELEAANLVVCRVDSIDLRFRAPSPTGCKRASQATPRPRRDRRTLRNQPGGATAAPRTEFATGRFGSVRRLQMQAHRRTLPNHEQDQCESCVCAKT